MDNLEGAFSHENTPEGHTDTHKGYFLSIKQISMRICVHEWLRMTNVFIICDLVWKVQKGYAAKRVGSFNCVDIYLIQCCCLYWYQ